MLLKKPRLNMMLSMSKEGRMKADSAGHVLIKCLHVAGSLSEDRHAEYSLLYIYVIAFFILSFHLLTVKQFHAHQGLRKPNSHGSTSTPEFLR